MLKDLTGQTFDRLTVISRVPQTGKTKNARWLCQCSCGNTHEANSTALLSGKTRSCKCLAKELTAKKFTQHAGSKTPEWNTWQGMRQRCYNQKNKKYPLYGGRGVTVCDRWLNSFEAFRSDMDLKPSSAHSLDRIDVNGNYEPLNCRWATPKVQSNNTRETQHVTIDGETKPLQYWIDQFGIAGQTVRNRIRSGAPQSDWFKDPYRSHTIGSESKPVKEWAIHFGLKPDTVYRRIGLGWPEEKWFLPLVKKGTRYGSHQRTSRL